MTPPARPGHFWSLYLLVGVALANLGGGMAQAAYYAYNLGGLVQAQQCMAELRLSAGAGPPDVESAARAAVCAAAMNYRQGIAMLVGAAAMLAAAFMLTVLGAYAARRRLRGLGPLTPSPIAAAAAGRFEAWCDSLRLFGRLRPRLILVPPSTEILSAFTVAVPWSRPLVVMPLNTVYGEAAFDALALHELAHVRARDPVWAASVWWTGWLVVPAFLIGLAPFLGRPQVLSSLYGTSLGLIVMLAVAALLLRSALLRNRELHADRFAVELLGGAHGLRAALAGDRGRRSSRWTWVRRFLATHPPGPVRSVAAEAARPDRWEGGFLFSAVTGILSMYTAQSLNIVLCDLRGPIGSPILIAALGSAALLWSAITLPAWVRRAAARARSGSPPRWWPAVAGAALGLGTGVYLRAPGLPSSGQAFGIGHPPAVAAVVVVVGAGVAALTAGLAAEVAAATRPRLTAAVALAASSVVLTVALTTALLTSQSATAGTPKPGALVRQLVYHGGPLPAWVQFVAPALLGLLVVAAGGKAPRPAITSMSTATIVGAIAAGVGWQVRLPRASSDDAVFHLIGQRAWACALAGLAVVVVLLAGAARRDNAVARREDATAWRALPWAMVAGFATAAGAGLLAFVSAAAAGVGFNRDSLVACLRQPMWLLLVALLVTLPWLLTVSGLAARLRRRPGAATGTAAVAGVLLLALFSGALAPITTAGGDFDIMQAAARAQSEPGDTPRTVPPTPLPTRTKAGVANDPGRPLDQRTGTTALDAVGAILPADRHTVAEKTADDVEISPRECQELAARHTRDERRMRRTADVARTYALDLNGAVGGRFSIHVGVVSYATPVRDFRPALDELAQCSRMRIRTDFADDGWIHVTFTRRPGAAAAGLRLSTLYTSVARQNAVRVEVNEFEDIVIVGHNRVTVRITYGYAAIAPPEHVRAATETLTRAAAQAAVDSLRR